jgi:hypothetical protein
VVVFILIFAKTEKRQWKNDRKLVESKTLCTAILKPRSETVSQLLTTSDERSTGMLEKMEVAPGVYIAESPTTVADGKCVSSIINANDKEIAIGVAPV